MLVLVCAVDPEEVAEREEEEEEGGDDELIVLTAVFADTADLEQALPKVLDGLEFTINGKNVAYNANKHKFELDVLEEPFLDPMVGGKPDKEYEVIIKFPEDEDPGYTGYYVLEYNPRH